MEKEEPIKISRKPVPTPRNLSNKNQNPENKDAVHPDKSVPAIHLPKQDGSMEDVTVSDDVFHESNIEINQNLENERKLRNFRNKSYEVALEDDSLDVNIPGTDSSYGGNSYLPMGMGLLAAIGESSEKSKPVPKPRPLKSQSVDDLESKQRDGRYSVLAKSPTVDSSSCSSLVEKNINEKPQKLLVPSRQAPLPPAKPVSDSDVKIDKNDLNDGKELKQRPKSTTWYDTDLQVKEVLKPSGSADLIENNDRSSEERNIIRSHDEDIKLPTRKEKHSFIFGSQIFETIKSWTGVSSSKHHSKSEKSDETHKDRSSKFYCNIADIDDKPQEEVDTSISQEKIPPIPSPRSKISSSFSPPVSPPNYTTSSPLMDGKNIQSLESDEPPPLPPPRSKRKSRYSDVSLTDNDDVFKSPNLDLMAEIKETLEDLNKQDDNTQLEIINHGAKANTGIEDEGDDLFSITPNLNDKNAFSNVNQNDDVFKPNVVSINNDFPALNPNTCDSPDGKKINACFEPNDPPQIDDLDVVIPPAGVLAPQLNHKRDSDDQKIIPGCESAPVSPAPTLPYNLRVKEDVVISVNPSGAKQKQIVKKKQNRNSDLDIVVHEDNDSSSTDSEYYDGYVEPGSLDNNCVKFQNKDDVVISKYGNAVKGKDSSCLEPPLPALPPRSRSVSPASVKLPNLPPPPIPSHPTTPPLPLQSSQHRASSQPPHEHGYKGSDNKNDTESIDNSLDVIIPAGSIKTRLKSPQNHDCKSVGNIVIPATSNDCKLIDNSLDYDIPANSDDFKFIDNSLDNIIPSGSGDSLLESVLHTCHNKGVNIINNIPSGEGNDEYVLLSQDNDNNQNIACRQKSCDSSSTLHESGSSTSTLTGSMNKISISSTCQITDLSIAQDNNNAENDFVVCNDLSEAISSQLVVDNSKRDDKKTVFSLESNSPHKIINSSLYTNVDDVVNTSSITTESQNVIVDKSESETVKNSGDSKNESESSEATTPTEGLDMFKSDSSIYVSADSDNASSNANLDSVIPVYDEDNLERTLKPNMLSQIPVCSSIESNSRSSSEEQVYEMPDDSYAVAFDRNSDKNNSFNSSTSSSEHGVNLTTQDVKLRRDLNVPHFRHRGDSSGSDSSSRPASWASFSSGASSDIAASHYFRLSGSQSLDVLYSSPDISMCSARSSLSSLDQSDEEDENKDEEIKQEEKRKKKLFYVAREMMTSERSFVDILKLLNEDFRNVIARSSAAIKTPVVPPTVLSQILRHLPELQKFNEALLHDLTERVNKWDSNPKIADIFVKKGPFLKLYTAYIMDFEHKSAVFEDARKKYFEFDKCTTYFEASARCQKLGIPHYMLKPVQRLPQYRLLLTDYSKYLTKDSPDYEDAKTALAIVTEVAEHANQSMKYGENINKLLEIQNSLVGRYEVIRPGRYLIKEGELMKLSRKEMQPRHFFLLNDVLLYTTPYTARYNSAQYRLNNALPLLGMKVDVPNKEGYQNEFSIISTQRSFTVCTKTPEEKDEWLKVLREAISDNSDKRKSFVFTTMQAQGLPIPPEKANITRTTTKTKFKLGSQHPIWIPDTRVSMCMLCTGEFTLAFRRHHCRACGKVVCAFCSDYKAPLHYLGNKPGRVCKDCYGKLRRVVRGSLSSTDTEKTAQTKELLNLFSKSSHGIKSKLLKITESQMHRVSQLRETLGMGSWTKPQALKEVSATDPYAVTNGYLKLWKDKKWNKRWYVLKGKVLYGFKGSEDTAASDSTVLLGYEVRPFLSYFNGVSPQMIFELVHKGLPNMIFSTESPETKDKWMKLMRNASMP